APCAGFAGAHRGNTTMRRIRWTTLAGLALAAACVALAWWNPWETREAPPADAEQAQVETFRAEVKDRQRKLAARVGRYQPAHPAPIDDLSVPLAEILRGLPGVM